MKFVVLGELGKLPLVLLHVVKPLHHLIYHPIVLLVLPLYHRGHSLLVEDGVDVFFVVVDLGARVFLVELGVDEPWHSLVVLFLDVERCETWRGLRCGFPACFGAEGNRQRGLTHRRQHCVGSVALGSVPLKIHAFQNVVLIVHQTSRGYS